MSGEANKRKQFLFVDDDAAFLSGITELLGEMGRGSWRILTAQNHAQALAVLSKERVDVVVVDYGMPVIDGLEFLRLLGRAHPGQQAVILTGSATEAKRRACLESGAALFLEKPLSRDGFSAVFAALDALAGAPASAGFRGVLHRVGLQEVLQLECLGRKSSVLEVVAATARGRIYISEGAIVHAESGALQGEVALFGLLALQGGDFNFLSFNEPSRRTIEGPWEHLLMEAARLSDEGATFSQSGEARAAAMEQARLPEQPVARAGSGAATPEVHEGTEEIRIEEVLLCSGAAEVLYEWKCQSLQKRMQLLAQIEYQAGFLSGAAPVGRFDRLELVTTDGRIVCQIQPDRRLVVRSRKYKLKAA
jgi:CheY-like chemotaxis protein